MDPWHEMVRAFGAGEGAAIVVAAILVLAVRLVLPREYRRYAVAPFVMLVLHVLARGMAALFPEREALRDILDVTALALLLLSFARSGFLLTVHAVVMRRLTRPLPKIFKDLLQALVYMGVALVVLSSTGVEPGSLLTTSALLTAVIGLSLQDTLGNMFAGLAIQAQRPFDNGDWIQYGNEPGHLGRVIEMNWRAVTVQTLERVEMIIPNSTLADSPLRNFSRPSPLVRREAFVWAAYDVPPHRVRSVILDAVRDVVGVLPDPPPAVLAREFSERGVQYWVTWFITDFDNREPISAAVRERMWYALQRAGIAIPPPKRHVTLEQVTDESRARQQARQVEARERALQHVSFLAHLPADARRRLAEQAEERLYAPNEVIIREGQRGHELFIIERGEVRVVVDRADMSIVELARLGPEAFFGEMSLMTGEPRRATVRAVDECEVIVLRKDALAPLLAANPDLATLISRKLAEREAELDQRVAAKRRRGDEPSVEERSSVLLDRIRKFFHL
jgi:small-conductance mechanosensitive channel/CRP-like cAMP-binding protein